MHNSKSSTTIPRTATTVTAVFYRRRGKNSRQNQHRWEDGRQMKQHKLYITFSKIHTTPVSNGWFWSHTAGLALLLRFIAEISSLILCRSILKMSLLSPSVTGTISVSWRERGSNYSHGLFVKKFFRLRPGQAAQIQPDSSLIALPLTVVEYRAVVSRMPHDPGSSRLACQNIFAYFLQFDTLTNIYDMWLLHIRTSISVWRTEIYFPYKSLFSVTIHVTVLKIFKA